ncbi:DUF4435 domain-containing protein [Salmonella enterica]|uniref:DUF4435 domain-containing protein n=1 Tax=Salmonella enterica TaxID=28901 RepID=UPI00098DF40B|nr:DUF4435 domain-containing protein [Salmonella enterica]
MRKMASVKQIIRDIKEQKVDTTGRRVLLVEGTDDVTAFQNFLSRKFPAWEQDWILAPAGSKKNVLEALALEANWLGVVDRDAWTDVQIAEKRRNLANLLVLPRFCIESYLIAPEELWLVFQPKHQQAINGGIQAFIQAVHDVLPQWRNHAALWNVIHPLWERLRAAGFNTAFHDLNTAQNDAEVEQCLRQWSQHLDPDVLLAQIQTQKTNIAARSPTTQLTQCFHGKMFFEQAIDPLLTQLLGQRAREQRQKDLFRTLPVPDDLTFIWNEMGL